MTEPQARALVAMIVAAYPTPSWERPQMEIYRRAIQDRDVHTAQRAIDLLIRTRLRNDRPSPGDVNLAIDQLEDPQPDIDQAWAYVLLCIRKVGHTGTFPTKRHPLIAEVVASIGWRQLCMSENPEADRAHFTRFYQTAVQRRRTQRQYERVLLGPPLLKPQLTGPETPRVS